MNDEQERASQLSALYDGELPMEQAQLVVRRTLKDAHLQAAWGRYALIGAVMRDEPLAVADRDGADLATRIAVQLEDEPLPAGMLAGEPMAGAIPAVRPAWMRGAWGTAIAAGVAAASLLVLRMQDGGQAPVQMARQLPAAAPVAVQAGAAVQAQPVLVAANDEPPSYTTPVDDSPPGRVTAPLVNYVVAHSDLTGSVVRFGPLSSVVSASYDPAADAVEMSEAEIGALR